MEKLDDLIQKAGYKLGSFELAETLDAQDRFNSFRDEFVIPSRKDVATKQPVIGKKKKDIKSPSTKT